MLSLQPAVRVLASLTLSLAAAVPRAAAPPPCSVPDPGGWREYTTPHFVLTTDVPSGRVPALVRQLEETHALVVSALFGEVVPTVGRVHAVAFSDARPFEELAPAGRSGYGVSAPGERWIVFRYDGRAPGAAFTHELTHALSWQRFPRQPAWFHEGLAQFLETVGRARDDRPTVFESIMERNDRAFGVKLAGLASGELLQRARSSPPVSARELLAWRGPADDAAPGRFNASSWVLYHWLSNDRQKQLSAYEDRLANGEDPAAAWAAAFPDLDPAKPGAMARLDDALSSYRSDGRYPSFRVRTPKVDPTMQERPVSSAELHVLRVAIRHPSRWPAGDAARKALRRAEYDEAIREDPLVPDALAARARDEGKSVAAALTPVTVMRPADARGWLLLGDALDPAVDPREKEDALRRAAALAPDDARPNVALARLLAGSGRAEEARPFAERAMRVAPWDPQAAATLAEVAPSAPASPVAAAK